MKQCLSGALVSVLTALLCAHASAATYRVGPGEEYATLTQVAYRLSPGDVVEITGDIQDTVVLARSGTSTEPITVRGLPRVISGDQIRPVVTPGPANVNSERIAFTCKGDYNVIENLEFAARGTPSSQKAYGVFHDCDNLTVRNCRFHHFNFKAICGSPSAGSITIEFCEFESSGTVSGFSGKTVDVWSWKPGSVMRVEHCYFHDALGQCHLKTHCTRNIIRYNWFENAYQESLNITDRLVSLCPTQPAGSYPMHSDVVGNVFIQGCSPGVRYSTLSTGGHGKEEPGPQGDLSYAHNLFVMNVFGPPNSPTVFELVQGDVDRVRMYNNVFMQMGGPACLVYLRDLNWDTPDTREFIKRRGSADPIVEGANNWIFEGSAGIPDTFKNTLRGLNPRFVGLLNSDYRPRKDSPLARAGLWPLPKGRMVDLAPEYEPQRGIPVDLKPKPRPKVTPPSIGPFEVPEVVVSENT